MSSRASVKKLQIKRKRNLISASINFPFSSTYSKTNNILLNHHKTNNIVRNNSQPHLKDKTIVSKSNNDIYSKILTPQNQNVIKLRDRIISPKSTNRKKVDNKSLYTSLISKIENITLKYKKNTNKLYSLLTQIDNFINTILKEDTNKNKTISDINKVKVLSLKNNIIKYNYKKNNTTKNKLDLSKEFIDNERNETENNLMRRKINKLYQKINDMEIKFKIDELNYFFCIGEYQKKINDLEKKLNLKKIDKLPKEELKKFLCYPHYIKFDIKEEVNPKSIPMYNLRKHKCKSSTTDNRGKKNEITYFDSGNTLFEKYFKKLNDKNKNNQDDNKNNDGDNNDNKDEIFNETKNNINNDINENEEIKLLEKVLEINEIKETIKLGKKKFEMQIPIVDKFFGKKKSFFISHPKLNYVKVGKDGNQLTSWKIDNQLKSLPQQISKLKISKSQKNAMIVFPSSFNETMVNLEKLRTNKNFRSIENKFEETFKIKHKPNKS